MFPQQFSTHIRVLVIDYDINFLNAIEKQCYQLVMCVDDTKSAVMKAIDSGACDYWIKPLSENLIQNMWQHVARKMWNENKNIESSEKIEFEKRQENVEKINDKPKSSTKKTRFKWSTELHKKFVSVVMELNVDKAVPKKILARMNVPGLTKEHVASHLQKYRDKLKRGGTKKQKTHIIIAEATTESMISNESSEFDFQAYDASTPHASTSHVSNDLIPMNIINEAPINFYQSDYEEDIISAFINQHNFSEFETNSIINASFINTLNAHYPNMQVQDIFLANGIIPHQIPMTQSLPMIFENSISS